MSKKQQFLKSEQNRDKHPERDQAGSPARAMASGKDETPQADRQQPGAGKVANDHNKMGHQAPTQANEGRRTPESRHDRENLAGSQNQVTARKGGGGAGRGPRGAG